MQINSLKDFLLVGGTGLSLQVGHRISIDIDLFSPNYPIDPKIVFELRQKYPKAELHKTDFSITMYVNSPEGEELKLDIMSNEEFIRPTQSIEGVRFAHIEDIAAMKLEAITSRKEKKDFWDIYELLKTYSFSDLIHFYKERYPWNDIREIIENIPKMNICDKQPDPIIFTELSWSQVKSTIKKHLRNFIDNEINHKNNEPH